MAYLTAKARARYRSQKPSLTDQSQAAENDVNVIVRNYAVTGTAPGRPGPGITGDFTQLPPDLRGLIEQARSIEHHRKQLPKALQDLTIQDLCEMDNQALLAYLKPAVQPTTTEKPQETAK